MPEIIPYATFDRKYTGIAKYPAVTRDISMVVPKEILVGQIEDVIEKKGGAHLESFNLFDIYEGAQIKAGFKSVAYSIVFRARIRHWKKLRSQQQWIAFFPVWKNLVLS